MEELISEEMGVNKRPSFLRTLCILSFIMCGLMLLISLWGLKTTFAPSERDIMMQEQQMEMIKSMNPDSYETIVKSMETKNISTVVGLITQIFSLIGVILMWKMKKTGFYVYAVSEILPYFVTIVLTGVGGLTVMAGMFGESMQSVIYVIIGLAIIIDFGFIVMYALNLKHMK